jgi:hypothetical protein
MWEVSRTDQQSGLNAGGDRWRLRKSQLGPEVGGIPCRRFRGLSPVTFLPVGETSGVVHETSENDSWGGSR